MKWFIVACLLLLPNATIAADLTVKGGKKDSNFVVMKLPKESRGKLWNDGQTEYLQCGDDWAFLQTDAEAKYAVVNLLKAEETTILSNMPKKKLFVFAEDMDPFQFSENKGGYLDVLWGNRPVLRFVDKPHDAKDHYLTFKPFHQMFDPKDGKTLLSSGAHPNTKEFLFPHHRGLFFGFNKISYGDKQTADIWHGTDNVFSTTDKILEKVAGIVFARYTAAISWHGKDGKTFANEKRIVTVYHVPGGTLLEWATELSTTLDSVKLDGDPQHAGFHFRATQEVSKTTAKQTYYLRPDGKGKEGETRNWDAKGKDPKTVDLPWNAMSFVTGEKRYTVLRIPHPDNPKGTRGSERDYGRFGDYFEYELTCKTALKLKYRIWLQDGEMTVEQCEAIAAGYTQPVTVNSKN